MDLQLSDDRKLMRDEARRLLAERADSRAVRRAIETGDGFDAELWRTIGAELGWCALTVPEAAGGLGLGAVELTLLMEEAGRRLAPVPLWSTAGLATPLLAALAGDDAAEAALGRIAEGAAATVAFDGLAPANPAARLSLTAMPAERGYTLHGRCRAVTDLAAATLVIAPARLPDGAIGLFALTPADGYAVAPRDELDLTRPTADLTLDALALTAEARLDGHGLRPADFDAPLAFARLALAAEQVGAAQGALDLTLAFITERVQFGRTIASFQAIKHRCAALLVDIAEARSLTLGAANSLDAGAPEAALEIAAAGALATEALWRAAEEAIQLHGGVGNTWEYDPHLYLRRAQATRHMLGDGDDRLGEIADRLLARGAA